MDIEKIEAVWNMLGTGRKMNNQDYLFACAMVDALAPVDLVSVEGGGELNGIHQRLKARIAMLEDRVKAMGQINPKPGRAEFEAFANVQEPDLSLEWSEKAQLYMEPDIQQGWIFWEGCANHPFN